MWRVREPAYCIVNGYFFARADPDVMSVVATPPRFIWSELRGGWLPAWRGELLPAFQACVDRCLTVRVESAGDDEITGLLEQLAEQTTAVWYALALSSGSLIPLRQAIRGIAGRALWEVAEGEESSLLSGFSTPVAREQESLYRLARMVAASPAVSRTFDESTIEEILRSRDDECEIAGFRSAIETHIATFGHQVVSLDFRYPALAEEPARMSVGIRVYLQTEARDPAQVSAKLARDRDRTQQRLLERLAGPRRALLERVLGRARGYAITHEEILDSLQRAWPCFRRLILALGERLVGDGRLDEAADVFVRSRVEVGRGPGCQEGEFRESVAARRRQWEDQARLDPPSHLPSLDDPAWGHAMRFPVNLRRLSEPARNGRKVLLGTAASPGEMRGTARVLGSPAEFARLKPGDILVTVATTPDWTPLFSRAGAVVTDVGAVTSHCSVVAREYGIPAVVGTQSATRSILDGQQLTVDGGSGVVYLG
jgi:pyruvate,water dikinase